MVLERLCMMGLIKGTVKLEDNYEKFIEEYKIEKENLLKIFRNENIVIDHIGSTSVKGLKAKPIIDIAIGVDKFKDFEYYLNLFNINKEYEVRNSLDINEILIVKGDKDYTSILIHLMELNSDRYKESILFRDYLRNNLEALLEYQKLKEDLALKYSNNRVMYTKSKDDFIKNMIIKASESKIIPVKLFELNHILDSELTRVIIVSRYKDKWILCKHKEKGTWEVPGGHMEVGEDWLTAAKRELLEETGISNADIEKVCFYKISTYGLICYAEVIDMGNNELFHEMDEVALFDELPNNMTYYDTHKMFVDEVIKFKNNSWNVKGIDETDI